MEQHECLWYAASPTYHNKTKRDIAWAAIEKVMGLDPKEMAHKWSSLRIQYRGYAAKTKTKSGQAAVIAPKWKFFSAMAFDGRAEEEQRQPTLSNLLINDEASIATAASSRPSTATPSRCSSSEMDLVSIVKDAVDTIKDKQTKLKKPNEAFGVYIVSLLNALDDDDAEEVRNDVTIHTMQLIRNVKKAKQQQNKN